MNLKHFQNTARQSFWVVHIEAWRRSGLARTAYCRHQRLNRRTFDRWMNYLLGEESASKHAKYLGELRDRKSTRLNSSHEWISYAVFCLKKKKTNVYILKTTNNKNRTQSNV